MTAREEFEVTWIGKENRPYSGPRILMEHSQKPDDTASQSLFSPIRGWGEEARLL